MYGPTPCHTGVGVLLEHNNKPPAGGEPSGRGLTIVRLLLLPLGVVGDPGGLAGRSRDTWASASSASTTVRLAVAVSSGWVSARSFLSRHSSAAPHEASLAEAARAGGD